MEPVDRTSQDPSAPLDEGSSLTVDSSLAPEDGDGIAVPLWRRIVDTFFSPGRMAEAVAARPTWAMALLIGGVLIALQTALIPVEIWESAMRAQLLSQGRELPEGFAMSGNLLRLSGLIGGILAWFVVTFILSGLVTLIFAFILGDEGRYTQYLAAMAHAWMIPAVIGLCLVPLRIAQEDPQLNLSLANFFFFLEPGYLKGVLKFLDLSQLWAWAVLAQGAHAVDPRRSYGSALTVLLGIFLCMALIFGRFIPVT